MRYSLHLKLLLSAARGNSEIPGFINFHGNKYYINKFSTNSIPRFSKISHPLHKPKYFTLQTFILKNAIKNIILIKKFLSKLCFTGCGKNNYDKIMPSKTSFVLSYRTQ